MEKKGKQLSTRRRKTKNRKILRKEEIAGALKESKTIEKVKKSRIKEMEKKKKHIKEKDEKTTKRQWKV